MNDWDGLSPKTYCRDQVALHHRLRTDSPSPERLPKSSITMTTDSDEVVNSKQSLRWKKHKLLGKHLSCNDSEDEVTDSVSHAVPSSEIMSSLSKINNQLGEVLTRLSQSTVTATSSIQPYPNNDSLLLPRRPDKTEEELQSKWLHYLGKQVFVFACY